MTKSPSSICVIVPTYNRSGMLREALDSILALTRPVQEIIVVNDGSTDDTTSVVQSYGGQVKLITKKNGGKSSALNLGLRQCTSDYVLFCDDDDLLAPDGVEHLALALDANDSLDYVFGNNMSFQDNGRPRIYSSPQYWIRAEEPNININFLEGMFTQLNTLLVRRRVYSEVGDFREDLIRSQDYDMAIRLSLHRKAAYVPKTIFFLREHQGLRGTAQARFHPDDNKKKWMAYDQKILTRVRQEFPLEEFIPTYALHWESLLAKRASLMQRAYIFAERGLWKDALDDIEAACSLSEAPASPEDMHLAEMLFKNSLSLKVFSTEDKLIANLQACFCLSNFGRDVVLSALRPLTWRSRQLLKAKNYTEFLTTLRVFFGVFGFRNALKSLIHAYLR